MNIVYNLVPPSKYSIKCPYYMVPEFIVVHNTFNDASAANEVAYMIRNDDKVSFHYAVDDMEIVQGIPENRNAWHAGDGENGPGNRKGLSVEICYSKSGGKRFEEAEKLAARFIAYKLNEKGWGVDRVKKHQDFSGKYCPHRTLYMGWQRFLNMVQAELDKLKEKDKGDKDIPSTWAQEAWEWAKKEGITDGTRPRDPCTREEVITMLYRYQKQVATKSLEDNSTASNCDWRRFKQ
ncbi:N-acetylmuramoyl-L-alanine amidase [Tepidanaerobacter sp. GT38]|uniref:peptidoglycan recognition protein family protein n=1 Tax=Tepidanaerobacter sp. GT38 TaxID=2722793 RepID=UPI00272980C8|nr:N-acetylmuramoyl-L-alanine amidase [Tepidanaerobacter sp. GT38]MCG1012878.1 N-acetylmuramoyl-L-alanine amidase [Tepidanaerobacter sp. GT38]